MSQVVPMGDRFNRNVLFSCLGSPGKPVVDTVGPLLLQAGDRLLLCTDGLWGTVSDSEITDQLASLPLSDSVPELVEQALRNGGAKCDNVSVVAMAWEGVENDSGSGIQTTSLGEAVFASTIQASARHRRLARRARRRRHRTLDQRDQRGDKEVVPAQEGLTPFSRRDSLLTASLSPCRRSPLTGLLPPRFAPLPPRGRGGRRWRPS